MVWILRFLVTFILMGILRQARPDYYYSTTKHRYKRGDPITLYANKVGPFANPSETYEYYSLPYCHLGYLPEKKPSLGEILNGDRLVLAPYDKLDFLVDRTSEILCSKNMTKEEVYHFRTAVAQDYYVKLYLDELPIWAFVGKVDRDGKPKHDEFKYFIYTHLQFEIFYSGNYLIEANIRTDPSDVTDITMDKAVDVEFLYTVRWKETNNAFEDMQRYTLSNSIPSIHIYSITNSLVTILILIGCLWCLYVRILQRDFYKVGNDEDLASTYNETGWKVLHGDVFRYPNHKSFFTAAVGCGLQSLTVIISIILLGYIGVFRPYDHGIMKTALVFSYAATCGVAGFTAVSLYHQLEGTNWVWTLFRTGCLSFSPLAIAFSFLNTIAATYGTTIALRLSTITVLFLVWVLLALPLLLLGGVFGKLYTFKFQAPCLTKDIPQEIPTLHWYRGLVPQMLFGGLLPFSVIYVQLYYIFASVWGHRIFTLYGVLLVVFILLIVTIALVSVGLTYFQLAAEDYHWWWRSFLCGGSTGLYVFGYCCYYYVTRSDMDSFMQISFFFGYMAWICYSLFLMSGSVGFGASFLFVQYIYSNIKCD